MIRAAVRRPVVATMIYAAVALLGAIAWREMPVELLPDTELPRLTVTATWPGTSPETVEAFLTAPLEATLQQVRSVERIESISEEGRAYVTVELQRDADMRFVRLDLSERLAALERDLPPDVRGPWTQAYVPQEFADQARSFMRYTVTGPLTLEALGELVDSAIAPGLRDVEGVAQVVAAGGRRRAIEVELDEVRARALGLDPDRLRAQIASLEIQRAGGAVEQGGLERPVAMRDPIGSVTDILDMPVVADARRLVRLRDVAVLRDTREDAASHYRVDGRPAVTFDVFREPRTNVVDVAGAVRARIDDLRASLPPGVRLILEEDQSDAIRRQMSDLRFRALVGAGVIFLVLLLFLRSVPSSIVVFATIAFSILCTLNLMHFGGLTLNMLTLMGLAMGFGLIDDNAIVVLESVHRRLSLGDAPAEAAERGAREVLMPVIAATATTVAVVVPFVWLQGELRAYYLPFAIVVGFSMIASLLVSFTFVPALAARILPEPASRAGRRAPASQTPPRRSRLAAVPACATRNPWRVIVATLVLVAASFRVFDTHVPRGVLWTDWWSDRSSLTVQIELPRGADIGRTDEYARFFEAELAGAAGVERYVTSVGAHHASIRATFDDPVAATALPLALKERLVVLGRRFGDADVRVHGLGPSFHAGGASPPSYAIHVLGYNYAMVRDIAQELGTRLTRFPRVRDVDTNASGRWYDRDRATEVVLRLDRARLAAHGLTARDVVDHVRRASGGAAGGQVIMVGGDERTFVLRSSGARHADSIDLEESLVPAPGGAEVRLGEIATAVERDVMTQIVRQDQQYRRVVTYEFRGPVRLGDRYRDAVVAATALPAGFAIEAESPWSWDREEQQQIALVVLAALALIFMVTAALFESLRQPFVVLLTVPMALTGVFLTFWLTGASFTREAYVGSIMMAGIVVNNAILLVDRNNQLARSGLDAHTAAVQAVVERARPILMTTATTVLGMLPLVLFTEAADANIWNAIGYAVIGGLISSTVLVLTVTPALLVVLGGRGARPTSPATCVAARAARARSVLPAVPASRAVRSSTDR